MDTAIAWGGITDCSNTIWSDVFLGI